MGAGGRHPRLLVMGFDTSARYIGPQYPAHLIGKWLRLLADQYEKVAPENKAVN